MRFTLVVSDKKYPVSFFKNFTFYKWCVTKVAHCIAPEYLTDLFKIRESNSNSTLNL